MNMLPPVNTYLPRLKTGATGLVKPVLVEATQKSRFAEYDSEEFDSQASSESEKEEVEEEEEEEEGDQVDDDLEEGPSKEQVARAKEISAQEASKEAAKQIPSETVAKAPTPLPPQKRLMRSTRHEHDKLFMSRREEIASTKEVLIPIRLEFDANGLLVRDVFNWNLNEQVITPEKFAEYICLDLGLDPRGYVSMIASNIRSQVDEYTQFFLHGDTPFAEDTRITIKLDIEIGGAHLLDRFEWDLASDLTPEAFAKSLVSDLGLGGDFCTSIAHSIREQCLGARRQGDIEYAFAIESPFRSEVEAKGWSPHIGAIQAEPEELDDSRRSRYTFFSC